MSDASPNVIVIAGPNGSGKSTAAPSLLRDYLGSVEFVNADVIAQGLSAFGGENVSIQAGRIMLDRLNALARAEADFAFETTLASRSFAPWLKKLQAEGYRVHLFFLWLPSPEMAIARVENRVRRGGHDIPADVVRRRFDAGFRNFFRLYRPFADTWRVFDNSERGPYRLIAQQTRDDDLQVVIPEIWNTITEQYQ